MDLRLNSAAIIGCFDDVILLLQFLMVCCSFPLARADRHATIALIMAAIASAGNGTCKMSTPMHCLVAVVRRAWSLCVQRTGCSSDSRLPPLERPSQAAMDYLFHHQ